MIDRKNEDINENELLDVENYSLPEQKEVIVDAEGKKTLDVKDLSPIELIHLTAKDHGFKLKEFEIKEGRIDTGCKRKGCWGRGYYAWDGNIPLPCKCLFHKEDRDNTKNPLNRNIIRSFTKLSRYESNIRIQDRASVYGLIKTYRKYDKESGKIRLLGETSKGVVFEWTNIKGKWDFRRYEPGKNPVVLDEEAE